MLLRPIPGYPALFASDEGNIYKQRADGSIRQVAEVKRRDGYSLVSVKKEGKWWSRYVHRLVLLAFAGEPPSPSSLTRHLDGNSKNNKPTNLAWGSASENAADTVRHGHRPKGSNHPNAKLNATEVYAIRQAVKMEVSRSVIAKNFDISVYTVNGIAAGRLWKEETTSPMLDAGPGKHLSVA